MRIWDYYRRDQKIVVTLNKEAEKKMSIINGKITINNFTAHILNCDYNLRIQVGNASTIVNYKDQAQSTVGTSERIKFLGVSGTNSFRVNAGTGVYLAHYLGQNKALPVEEGETIIHVDIPEGATLQSINFESELLFPESVMDDQNNKMTYAFLKGINFNSHFTKVEHQEGQSLQDFKNSLEPFQYGVYKEMGVEKTLIANFGVNGKNGLKFGREPSKYLENENNICVTEAVFKKLDEVFGASNSIGGNVPNLILKATFDYNNFEGEETTLNLTGIKDVGGKYHSEREAKVTIKRAESSGEAATTPDLIKDVEGREELIIPRGERYKYNVSTKIPKDVSKYEHILISDELDKRLSVVDAKALLDGEISKDISPEITGQTVTLRIEEDEMEKIAGMELTLEITAKINEDVKVERINNKAHIELNDNPREDSNIVTVTPPPEGETPPPNDEEKPEISGDNKLPKTATNMYNFLALGIISILLGMTLSLTKGRKA